MVYTIGSSKIIKIVNAFEGWQYSNILGVKAGGQPVKFRSEDYGMKFQYGFWF